MWPPEPSRPRRVKRNLGVTAAEGTDARHRSKSRARHHRAPGLIRMPDRQDGWVPQGMDLETDDTLTTRTLPRQTPLPQGYTVRRLSEQDWAQSVARSMAENDRTNEQDPQSFERFAKGQAQARRAPIRGGDRSVLQRIRERLAHRRSRHRPVRHDRAQPERRHRREAPATRAGLPSPRLCCAVGRRSGLHRWIIVTEATNPAERIYRSLGFEPDIGNAQAYRKPPR